MCADAVTKVMPRLITHVKIAVARSMEAWKSEGDLAENEVVHFCNKERISFVST